MKRLFGVMVGLGLAIVMGCNTEAVNGNGTSSGTSGGGGESQTTTGGGGGCGVFGPSESACGKCGLSKCCSEGKTCGADQACADCVARGSDGVLDPSCQAIPAFKAAYDCVNGPCYTECNGSPPSTSGGTGTGGSCSSVKCGVENSPAGNSICSQRGCGPCGFTGYCNVF